MYQHVSSVPSLYYILTPMTELRVCQNLLITTEYARVERNIRHEIQIHVKIQFLQPHSDIHVLFSLYAPKLTNTWVEN